MKHLQEKIFCFGDLGCIMKPQFEITFRESLPFTEMDDQVVQSITINYEEFRNELQVQQPQ